MLARRTAIWISLAFLAASSMIAACESTAEGTSEHEPGVDAGQDVAVEAANGTDGQAEAAVPFDIDPKRIRADIAMLTSDEFEGRLPGTPGGEKAIAYVESLFTDLGLTPPDATGFRTPFQFEQWAKTGPSVVQVGGSTLVEGKEQWLLQYSGSGSSTGTLAFAGYGITVPPFDKAQYPSCPFDPATGYDDFGDVDMTGKTVIVFRHAPNENMTLGTACPANEAAKGDDQMLFFGYKAANAKLHGASAVLLVQDWSHEAEPLQGTIDEAYYDAALPVLAVNRDKLVAVLPDLKSWLDAIDSSMKPNPQVTQVTSNISAAAEIQSVKTSNLVGSIKGTDPTLGSEVVVIGAHVDHLGKDVSTGEIYRGADDNASGTAVMMELARAAVLSGLKPSRTIVFMAFNAEEEGLIGSCYYVDKPLWPLAKTAAMFSVDMVGAGDGSGLVLYGAKDSSLAWLSDLMSAAAESKSLDAVVIPEDPVPNSDHACFAQAGVPAVMALSAGPHASYHTPQDTIDTIVDADLETSARLLWATIEPLATGTEKQFTKP